jgi:hypothetical protein
MSQMIRGFQWINKPAKLKHRAFSLICLKSWSLPHVIIKYVPLTPLGYESSSSADQGRASRPDIQDG